jgi:hypothetical protein
VPELDFALLSDYVRAEAGIAHIIAGGIDTINAPTVPTGQNLGLVFRLLFSRTECDRPHRVEVIFQDEDGARLAAISSVVTPSWIEGQPAHWKTGMIGGFNFGVPLPRFGLYSFEIMVNDNLVKSLPLRVVERTLPPGFEIPSVPPLDEPPAEE